MTETEAITHEVRVAAKPETVFDFFTDTAKLVEWMGIDATLDPRPGGACRITLNRAGVMIGEFVQVSRPWRLVLTWGWERELFTVPPQTTVVEVALTPDGDGTIVRLTHSRLPPAATEFHRAGWTHYLPRLATVAAGGDPGPDPLAQPAGAP